MLTALSFAQKIDDIAAHDGRPCLVLNVGPKWIVQRTTAHPANNVMNLMDKSDGTARIVLCDLIGYFF